MEVQLIVQILVLGFLIAAAAKSMAKTVAFGLAALIVYSTWGDIVAYATDLAGSF